MVDIIPKHIPGARYRIGAVKYELTSYQQGYFQLRGIDLKRDLPLSEEIFLNMLKKGELVLIHQAPSTISDGHYLASLTPAQTERFYRRLKYIKKAFREFGSFIPKTEYPDFIKRSAKEFLDQSPPSFSSLYRWMDNYRKSNCNPSSLLSNHDKGATRKRRIDSRALKKMHHYINEHYLDDNKLTMKLVYDMFSDRITLDNRSLSKNDLIPIPTYMSFKREVDNISGLTKDLARLGKYATRKKYAYGKQLHQPQRLCERVEADCNYIDLQLVDDLSMVVGRVYVLILLDVYSRCIIGWDLSFLPPCSEKIIKALRHAGSTERDTEISGLPNEILVDNGSEFVNASMQSFCTYYGVKIRYLAPRSPNQKSHVESFFGTLNTRFIHTLPGTTYSNIINRGDYNSEENATLTIDSLKKLFEDWVKIYHLEKHSGLNNRRPQDVWKELFNDFPTNTRPEEELDMNSRSTCYRTIRNGRIEIFSLSWTSPSLPIIAERLKTAGKQQNNRVQILFDPTNLSTIWVRDPDDKSILYTADPTRPRFQHDLSLFELNQMKDKKYILSSDSENELIDRRIALYEELAALRHSSKTARRKIARRGKSNIPYLERESLSNAVNTNKSKKDEDFNISDFPDEGFVLKE